MSLGFGRRVAAACLAAVLLTPPALAQHDRPSIFHMARLEGDVSETDDATLFTWDGESWVGGDRDRLWLKTEGEVRDGDAEAAELEVFYGRKVAPFWDLLVGARQDVEPVSTSSFALGVQGLAPYRFETEAFVYVSEEGELSLRAEQALDLLLSQRLVLEPTIEIEAFAQDVPERAVGGGLARAEAALRLRYEVTRKFAPYLELRWERSLGETAGIRRALGEVAEGTSLRAGIRAWF